MGPTQSLLEILLVEDNPGDARLIQTYLGNGARGPFRLLTVDRLGHALEALGEGPHDAILLDLGLPDSQGLETLDRVTACCNGAPVIVLTGLNDEDLALQAIQRGAQDYLPKGGFDEELLARTIRYAVERSLAEESIRASEERYRNLFSQANEAVLVVQDEKILQANPKTEELFGKPLAEIIGQPFADFVCPKDREMVLDRHRRRMRGEDPPHRYEFRIQAADQTPRWADVSTGRIEWDGRTAGLALLTDISERKAARAKTESLLDRQTAINELALALGTATEPEKVYRVLYDRIRALLTADGFIVSLYNAEAREIRAGFVVTQETEHDASDFPPIPLEEEGCGTQSQVIRSKRGMYIPDWIEAMSRTRTHYKIHDDGCIEEGHPESREEWEGSVQSALLAPMLSQGEVIGVLQVQSRTLNGYREEDLALLGGLANVAAIALRNAQLVHESRAQAGQLRDAFDGIVRTVAAAVETRDPYTAGHQQRVARLAVGIAETLGLSDETIEGVRVASLVHDIGKLGIPAEILAKPGRLTDTEFEIIQAHAENAFRILGSIEFPWPIAEVVYQHHERLDGSGYPRGLSNEGICLEARIMAVADVVEAMASHRPYRPALGLDRALEEIGSKKGAKFDPQVVEACEALFWERGFLLDGEAAG